jgi:hypothetical protein
VNWSIATIASELKGKRAELSLGEHESPEAKPDAKLVSAARKAATELAKLLGGEVSVEIHGHETTDGDSFRPAHVTLTVSRLDPDGTRAASVALRWRGRRVAAKVLAATKLAVDQTTSQAVRHAKDDHPWQNQTGTLEGSLQMRPAEPEGRKIVGRWGSFSVRYAIFLELGHLEDARLPLPPSRGRRYLPDPGEPDPGEPVGDAMTDPIGALVAHLTADPQVSALVADRVFGGELPAEETQAMPRKAIVVRSSGGAQQLGQGYQQHGDQSASTSIATARCRMTPTGFTGPRTWRSSSSRGWSRSRR